MHNLRWHRSHSLGTLSRPRRAATTRWDPRESQRSSCPSSCGQPPSPTLSLRFLISGSLVTLHSHKKTFTPRPLSCSTSFARERKQGNKSTTLFACGRVRGSSE